MESEQRQRIRDLAREVLEHPEEERTVWLKKSCEGDNDLFAGVVSALSEDEVATVMPNLNPTEKQERLSGVTIGPWRLVKELGRGGMGSVWLAHRADAELRMRVAVKLVKPELASDDILNRFRRERQIMADLNHPNIGTLHDAGTTESGQPYLIMEYVDGDTIASYCDSQRLGLEKRIQLFLQACEAVRHAHRKGVIHRDIKPGNIMVTADGVVKLMDFGIAAQINMKTGRSYGSSGSDLMMTPEYASPEQLRGQPAGVASDIYALGLVLARLVTGYRPKRLGADPAAGIRSILEEDATAANTEEDSGPRFNDARLATIMERSLALRIDERYETIQMVIDELEEYLEGDGATNDVPLEIRFHAQIWSHPSSRPEVEKLIKNLNMVDDIDFWLDWIEITPGEAIPNSYLKGLRESECLLVCAGPGGAESKEQPWMEKDVRDVLEKWIGRKRVVPVLLPGSVRPEWESALPKFLRRRAWAKTETRHEWETLARAIKGVSRDESTGAVINACPFKGLEAFREEDREFFFGREAVTQQLTEHIVTYRFLAVLGPSGSGKSSVVQAGVIPELRHDGYAVARFTPAKNPLEELAFALHRIFPDDNLRETPEQIHQRLLAGEEALHFMMREITQVLGVRRMCLVIDQFEEIFTLSETKNEVAHFLNSLLHAVEHSLDRVSVIITLRSDFVGRCVAWPELNTYISDHIIQICPMNRDELESAITEPAMLAGLRFEHGLVERILDDVSGASADLPLMEHALLELFDRRRGAVLTASAYHEIGGIEGALAQRAEAEFNKLDSHQQAILRKMFTLCLVHPGEGAEDTRRRASYEELMTVGSDPKAAEDLLGQWTNARLLTGNRDIEREIDTVDVAHEALIRKWERIRSWMAEDRETARLLNRLRRQASAWEEANRSEDHLLRGAQLMQMSDLMEREQDHIGEGEKAFVAAGVKARNRYAAERRRRQRILFGAVVGVAIGAILLMLVAFNAKKQAEQQTRVAESAILESNYNLAMMFRKEAGSMLRQGRPHEAWLYALAGMSNPIPDTRTLPELNGIFADPAMDGVNRLLWVSPTSIPSSVAAFSPAGDILAIAGADHKIRLLETKTGRLYGGIEGVITGHSDHIRALIFNAAGDTLISASEDGTLRYWSLDGGQGGINALNLPGKVIAMGIGSQGSMLAVALEDNSVLLMNEKGDQTDRFRLGQDQSVKDIAFSKNNQHLVIAFQNGSVRKWNLKTRNLEILETAVAVRHVVWAKDHVDLISVFQQGDIRVKDLSTGAVTNYTTGSDGMGVRNLAIHEERGLLALIGQDGHLKLWSAQHARSVAEPSGHSGNVRNIAISNDGKYFASASFDKTAAIWDSESGARLFKLDHEYEVHTIVFSPDDKWLASGDWGGFVKLWSVEDGRLVYKFQAHQTKVYACVFAPDGTWFATSSLDNQIKIWPAAVSGDWSRGVRQEVTLGSHDAFILSIDVSPDSRWLASGSIDGVIKLWDVERRRERVSESITAGISQLSFAPDGVSLAVATDLGTFGIWTVNTQRRNISLTNRYMQDAGSNGLNSISFSPDGRHIALGAYEKAVHIWDTVSGIHLETFSGHNGFVNSVAFFPDGQRLLSGSSDQTLRMWRKPQNLNELKTIPDAHETIITGLIISEDQHLVTMDDNGVLRIIEPSSYPSKTKAIMTAADSVAMSPSQSLLVTGRKTGGVLDLWDARELNAIGSANLSDKGSIYNLAFTPDGTLMASTSTHEKVTVWRNLDNKKLEQLIVLEGTGMSTGVDFSFDNQWLASNFGKDIYVWRVSDLKDAKSEPFFKLSGHPDNISSVRFGPDRNLLVSSSNDGTLRIWDVSINDRSSRFTLYGHTGRIVNTVFSPDGRWIASASKDHSIRLWDLETIITGDLASNSSFALLQGHDGPVNDLGFGNRGSTLASVSDDGSVRFWNLGGLSIPEDLQLRQKLTRRSLYHFGYRLDGFRLQSEAPFYLTSLNESNYLTPPERTHEKPRTGELNLVSWLLE